MSGVSYGIHWLSFTVHSGRQDAFDLYDLMFKDVFGDLEPLGHGGRHFKEILKGFLEFKIYLTPVTGGEQYFHFEIPGEACELITWERFQTLDAILESKHKDAHAYTRLDLAFDHVPFSPQQVEEAIRENRLRTLAKRKTMEVHQSPFAERDNGEVGTYTVSFGDRTSERMIRVYDKRGFIRLEIELKERRADLVGRQLFGCSDESEWFGIMVSHVRDFVDFEASWWDDFTNGAARAWATVGNAKDLTMAKLLHWFDLQVSPALSVIVDTLPEYAVKALIERGRQRRGPRYNALLAGNGAKAEK